MTPMVGCERARPLLTEFVDGELAVSFQVVVEAHVRVCRTCAAHLEDLQVIGSMLRTRAGQVEPRADLAALLARTSWRAQAEEAMSWPVRIDFAERRGESEPRLLPGPWLPDRRRWSPPWFWLGGR